MTEEILKELYEALETLKDHCSETEDCSDCPLERICWQKLQITNNFSELTINEPSTANKFKF